MDSVTTRWLTVTAARTAVMIVAAGALSACTGAGQVTKCIAGASVACECAGGGQGAQRCNVGGGYDACECAGLGSAEEAEGSAKVAAETTRDPRDSCQAAAQNAMKLAQESFSASGEDDELDEEMWAMLMRNFVEACEAQGWSATVRACVADALSSKEIELCKPPQLRAPPPPPILDPCDKVAGHMADVMRAETMSIAKKQRARAEAVVAEMNESYVMIMEWRCHEDEWPDAFRGCLNRAVTLADIGQCRAEAAAALAEEEAEAEVEAEE